MKNFALTGIAGYIAPRHLKAISDTQNLLVAALDPHDSVGILDRFFPEVSFFTDFERFDRHIDKLRRMGDDKKVHYVSICSPNHLHDAHIRFALRSEADAICEKPIVLNPWNLDALSEIEKETGQKVYTVLQLRVHPALIKLRESILSQNKRFNVVLTYITSRGPWYNFSWKGDEKKSGGIATNIGVHFFDLLNWLFGDIISTEMHLNDPAKMSGFIELKNADVRWFLSIDKNELPEEIKQNGKTTYRSITVDGSEIEFTEGFTDLHTVVYQEILAGNGYGLADARAGIETVYKIRNSSITKEVDKYHPFMLNRTRL